MNRWIPKEKQDQKRALNWEKPRLWTISPKLTAIVNNSSIFNGKKQFSSIYITYTLLMEAQGNLNEEALDDGQGAQILADFNDIDIEN